MSERSGGGIGRLIDILFLAMLAAAAVPTLALARLLVRRFGPATRDVMVSMTADSIAETRRLNSPSSVERFYTREPFDLTYVVHVGVGPAGATRLGRKVVGVEAAVPVPRWCVRWLPRTARALIELAGIAVGIRLLRRTGGNVCEVMSPSALVPRALLLKTLSGCRLTTQVRGNVDLLSYSLGTYFYCRIRRGGLVGRLLAGAVHRIIIEGFFRRCDLVVGYNLNNLQSAISNGADPRCSRLSRIAVDRTILEAPQVPRGDLEGFPQDGRVILLWSRLGAEKYVREAVEAFVCLAPPLPDVRLVMIGDGPLLQALIARAHDAGLAERILFLGYRDRSYIRSAAQFSNVALVPYGGSSLVEAVLLGLPVVAFDIEWHAELVRPGETGYLADFADAAHMAAQLGAALNDPQDSARMALACRQTAEHMFDSERVLREERRYYAALTRSAA
ncbi:MAG: glycosyltransferase [Proteobacteria bacterium]|nr:glycosyltransferase [Pseudomonadota bacterium]MDA1059063.1 glycosyltransferase [Pseudomonadota bacterium]